MDRKNPRGLLSVTGITNLSNNRGDSEDPRIAASDKNVYAVWQDNTPGNSEIFFAASSDSGTSFTTAVNLSNTSQDSIAPQIAVSGSNVYVVWVEKVSSSNWEVFFRRSTNGGASFDPAINLSNTSGLSHIAQILAFGNNVYLTFEDNTPGNYEVFFIRSTNGGASFDPAINLSNNPSASFGGKIAISKNRVFVVWFDLINPNTHQVLLRVSKDNGASFDPQVNVSNDNTRDASYPDIAVNGDTVYIVWDSFVYPPTNVREVFFNKSVNGGASFGTAINLSSYIIPGSFPPITPSISVRPQLAAAGNNVYVVWMQGDYIDFTEGDIAFIRSTNRGNSFGTAINLSNTPRSISEYPQIGVINNKDTISIVWEDRTGSWDIFMKNSMDCGATFSSAINLSNSAGLSRIPNIASSNNKDYFVWQDKTPGNFEVFFVSADNPDKFGSRVNLSNNNGSSHEPRIETSQANVHVVWYDNTTGFYEIYYKKSSDDGATFGPTINLSNTSEDSFLPEIAVSGSNVYVVWVEHVTSAHWKIFFKASTDGGMSFGPTLQLSENTSGFAEMPNVAVSGSNVYVVWHDPSITIYREIYLKVSTDNGSTFGNIINVSNSTTESRFPEIAVSGSNVYVVWMEFAVNYDILFRSSNDNGVTFGPTINLSNNSGSSQDEQIAVSGSNVYVVWRDNTPGNFDILFRSSNDNGVTFGPTINLSNTPHTTHLLSVPPRIAVSGSNVYVVWYDTIDPIAATEVLFRRSTNGGASFDNTVNLSDNLDNSLYPQIAVSGSNIYIVWINSGFRPEFALRNLFFIGSRDSGLTFDCNIIDITDANSINPRITLSNSSILVVWSDPPWGPTIKSDIFLVQGRR